MHSQDLNIDKSWTLFLDRDGVINEEKIHDYIYNWEEFKFYDGALEAFFIFAQRFNKIIIVTNQKGVGKGLTKIEELNRIHQNLIKSVLAAGGRIDAVYFCPDLDNNSPNRKPQAGMGFQAVADFPDIDVQKSIMVGNTMSDMEFGRNLGVAKNVFLPTTRKEIDTNDSRIDLAYLTLIDFAKSLAQ